MSLHSDLCGDVGVPLLTGQLGDSVTRWPDGVEADAETVTAIVEFGGGDGDHRVDFDRGRGFASRGQLHVAGDQELFRGDRWEIDGKKWETERIEPAQDGLRAVHVVRRESDATTSDPRTVRGR